jgi:hypothetical protein
MAGYINLNTAQRVACSKVGDKFGQDMSKILSNSVGGKQMENPRNRDKYTIFVTDEEEAEKRIIKIQTDATFKGDRYIGDKGDLYIGTRAVQEIKLWDKPTAVGWSILELSKVHMYKFVYEVLKPKFGNKVKVCYTDTDSLVLEFTSDDPEFDIYDVIAKDEELKDAMDLSNYPRSSPLYYPKNEKILGKFKDEKAGKVITEFVALSPKMYSIRTHDDKDIHRVKGVGCGVELKHQNYLDALYKEGQFYQECSFKNIHNKDHKLMTSLFQKRALSGYETKRHWINVVESRAYGHYLDRMDK